MDTRPMDVGDAGIIWLHGPSHYLQDSHQCIIQNAGNRKLDKAGLALNQQMIFFSSYKPAMSYLATATELAHGAMLAQHTGHLARPYVWMPKQIITVIAIRVSHVRSGSQLFYRKGIEPNPSRVHSPSEKGNRPDVNNANVIEGATFSTLEKKYSGYDSIPCYISSPNSSFMCCFICNNNNI